MDQYRSDSVADPTEGVKPIYGGTPAQVPRAAETWIDALSTRACVRLRSTVINTLTHEEFRKQVRGIERLTWYSGSPVTGVIVTRDLHREQASCQG